MADGDILWEPRHNIVAFLDDSKDTAVPYRPMVAFLRRSRIYTAITATTTIYKDQVSQFWENAVINSELPFTRIIYTVGDRQLIISEQVIRDFFHFGDTTEMPTLFANEFIAGAMTRLGYPGVPNDQYRKANLPKVWRYLMHVLIVCLSPRKAGFDGISHSTASAMLALIYNKPFNFSGYIFRAMVENLNAGDKRWNLYPRFIQLFLDNQLPGLPQNARERLRPTPMNVRIWTVCAAGANANNNFPLSGHIIDEAYVAPPNDGSMDVLAAPGQQIQ